MLRPSWVLVFVAACGGTEPVVSPVVVENTGRVVALTAPDSEEAGRAAGCVSYGAKVGSGVGNLVLLSGGLEQHLKPNDFSGRINLVMIANAKDWREGELDLEFLRGDLSPSGGFVVRPEAFVGSDPAQGARVRFPRTKLSPDSWFDTISGPFLMPVPIFTDFIGELELVGARVTGKISVDAGGLTIQHGVLSGYAPEAAIRGVLDEVNVACASADPPEVCPFVKDVLAMNGDADVFPQLLTFLGGLDARIEDGFPYPCDPAATPTDCNAVSACLLMEIAPVPVEGLASP